MNRQDLASMSAVVVFMLVFSLASVGSVLPTPVLPVHWGFDGAPTVFTGKWTALWLSPLLIFANSVLFYALPSIEPKQEGLARSQGLYVACWIAVIALHVARFAADISFAFGWHFLSDRLVVVVAGVALLLVGDQLSKSRRMHLLGIATPWALASEDIWIATHRFAGKLVMASSLLLLAGVALGGSSDVIRFIGVGSIAAIALPVLHSYRLWRNEQLSFTAGFRAARIGGDRIPEHRTAISAYWGSVAILALVCITVAIATWPTECANGACAGEAGLQKLANFLVEAVLHPYGQ